MRGYEVIASDGESVGTVVGEAVENLVVEHGTLLKSRHAIPRALAQIDEDAHVVRTTIAKRVIDESPKLDADGDEAAIAGYYGLAGGGDSPATEGYGEVGPADPAIGAERQEFAAGLEPAAAERARIREHPEQLDGAPADLRNEPSPHHVGRRGAF